MSWRGKTIKHIVAVGFGNGAIGKDNELLWRYQEDMNHFRSHTLHGVVVMGRKTYESIGHALKGRQNIVLTKDKNWKPLENTTVVANSIREALDYAIAVVDKMRNPNIYIIGGETIYKETMPFIDEVEMTVISKYSKNADAFYVLPQGEFYPTSIRQSKENEELKFVNYRRFSSDKTILDKLVSVVKKRFKPMFSGA